MPASPLAFLTPSTRMFSASAAQASLLPKDCVPQIVTSWPASLRQVARRARAHLVERGRHRRPGQRRRTRPAGISRRARGVVEVGHDAAAAASRLNSVRPAIIHEEGVAALDPARASASARRSMPSTCSSTTEPALSPARSRRSGGGRPCRCSDVPPVGADAIDALERVVANVGGGGCVSCAIAGAANPHAMAATRASCCGADLGRDMKFFHHHPSQKARQRGQFFVRKPSPMGHDGAFQRRWQDSAGSAESRL